MARDNKIIGGIFFLFTGFYILVQNVGGGIYVGLTLSAIGLYLILSNIK